MPPAFELGFPLAIRLTHAFNLVFLTLLIRSGIEILGGHPMLYFNDHCRPGSEWIRFTSKRMFRNQRWTAEDETEVRQLLQRVIRIACSWDVQTQVRQRGVPRLGQHGP
jgi:hypothetical protein